MYISYIYYTEEVRVLEELEHVCQTHRQKQSGQHPSQANQIDIPACVEWDA